MKFPGYSLLLSADMELSRRGRSHIEVKTDRPMNTKIITAIALTTASLTVGALGQTTNPAGAPAPVPAVSASVAPPAALSVASTPNQVVYAPRLPSFVDLTNAAAAQGFAIEKIEQTSVSITVVYRNASGQTSTVAYQLLPSAGSAPTAVATPGSPAPVVVYQQAPRVVYYDGYGPGYYYDPYYWYPPVSLRLGFGYRFGGHHHGR